MFYNFFILNSNLMRYNIISIDNRQINNGLPNLYNKVIKDKINDNVYQRHVVNHGSTYVNSNVAKNRVQVCRSFGCPAVDYKLVKPSVRKISNGSLVFSYYPLTNCLDYSEYLI